MNTGTLSDHKARRRIREDLDATLFVEAAAGTGKTTELVARVLAVIRSGRSTLDRLVAVTFTEKAAGEMKLRLREAIERARADTATPEAERAHLERALEHLEIARIGTLHAFCADLLRERPVEAGVDPLFEVAAEEVAEELIDRTLDDWFEAMLEDPPEGVRRVLRRRDGSGASQGPRAALRGALRALLEHRDFPTPWRRAVFDRNAGIDRVVESLDAIAQLATRARWPDDWLARNLSAIARFVGDLRLRETVRARDHDGLEAELRELARSRQTGWHWRGAPHQPFGPDLPRADVIARRDAAKRELDALLEAADADLAACLHADLRAAVHSYEALKRRTGRLDFLDLLLRARALVRDDAGIRAELQTRFTHFFVDEFQDTDPLQAELLLLLTADDPHVDRWREAKPAAGKLFLVGDPKQSIYRFRRADVGVYEACRRRLLAQGAEVVRLSTSFRSVASIQSAVNAAFEPVMHGRAPGHEQTRMSPRPDSGGPDHPGGYVALERWRDDPLAQPSIVALPVPRPYSDWGKVTNWRIEESLPDAVGAFVDWLIRHSGWTIGEPGDTRTRRAIAPRDVCLLFRRFKQFRNDVTRPYVRALENRGITHVLVGGHSFHEREEVLAIRNALCAIEWPDDELRVFASLKGPLFALSDDALLAFRHRFGRLRPMRRIETDTASDSGAEVADALALLAGLHLRRNHRPIADTISQLLEDVRAHAGIAIWPAGDQALANCLRVVDLARRFEHRGAHSFRAFVERLEADAERGDTQDAPLVEEGTEGVRIMTVHRAKGLEFPVVVLADPTCRATREMPGRHIDPDRGLWAETLCGCAPRELLDNRAQELASDTDEAIRLAYVAATRARDLLVIPTLGDSAMQGWLEVLNPVVYPDNASRRQARPAPGCPEFGTDSVLERPKPAAHHGESSVAPGLHRPSAGSHDVVWWDPQVLELGREESVGLRQQRILEADIAGTAAEAGAEAHARWQARRDRTLASGAVGAWVVRPVTSLAAAQREVTEPALSAVDPQAIELVQIERELARRPHGKRFGSLVHATLAVVDLHSDDTGVLAAARSQGRLLGAEESEVNAAAAAVSAALTHGLLRRAWRSAVQDRLYREVPLVFRLHDGTLAEGVIDLAFREDCSDPPWTIVDFKTDREIAGRHAEYQRQVALYVTGLQAATGEPAHGVLLVI